MQSWKNITVNLKNWDLKKAAELISNLDIVSVTILDKLNQVESQWFKETENEKPINSSTHSLIILADARKDTNELLYNIKLLLNLNETPQYSEEIFEDQDWVSQSRSHFQEIIISDTLRVVPPWDRRGKFNGTTIVIDPGSGFGTGTHPTTKLCLNWLEKNLRIGKSLLDYGCGSGILSIAGAFFGAKRITGIDCDNQALENARHNAKLNNLDLDLLQSKNFQVNHRYNIVIANILSNVLVEIEPILRKTVSQRLVLSGILPEQAIYIHEAFSDWLTFDQIVKQDGWLLLSGKV